MRFKRSILIDGDIVAYQFAARAEEPIEWDNEIWSLHADCGAAKVQVSNYIDELAEMLEADNVVVALSDPLRHYFRHDIYPEAYKQNRKEARPPIILKAIKEYLEGNYNSYIRPRLEADDILGILATNPKLEPSAEKVIVSLDKDMLTLPCLLFNPEKADDGIWEVSEQDADWYFMYQTLCGDPTDGYPGCPGVGPKTAAKLLKDATTLSQQWAVVVDAFCKAKLSYAEALRNARMARILRACDYNFKKREPKLWQPPKTPTTDSE